MLSAAIVLQLHSNLSGFTTNVYQDHRDSSFLAPLSQWQRNSNSLVEVHTQRYMIYDRFPKKRIGQHRGDSRVS